MKCDKCKEQEATFFYSSDINGQKTERRLCADCARAEGLDQAFQRQSVELFDGFDRMFGAFFRPYRGALTPFDSFDRAFGRMMTLGLPRLSLQLQMPEPGTETPAAAQPQSPAEAGIPDDAGPELRQRRERAALQHQLEQAVAAEDFEKAIELRDRLRSMDA